MTAPLFLLPPGALDGVGAGAAVEVDGDEARHAVRVRRIERGEAVDLADGRGERASGVVELVDRGERSAARLVLRVTSRTREPAPDVRLVLVQALAKGDRDEAAIEAATELGVDAIIPWQAERSIVQWRAERADKARSKWAATVRSAAKQSRRAWVPEVSAAVSTAELAELIGSAGLALVLHESASRPLAEVTLPVAGDVLVVVGPEGGIAPDEVERLSAAGAEVVRLGTSVLRSSTAGPAAIAALSARSRWT